LPPSFPVSERVARGDVEEGKRSQYEFTSKGDDATRRERVRVVRGFSDQSESIRKIRTSR
jgi:hypothetical protein